EAGIAGDAVHGGGGGIVHEAATETAAGFAAAGGGDLVVPGGGGKVAGVVHAQGLENVVEGVAIDAFARPHAHQLGEHDEVDVAVFEVRARRVGRDHLHGLLDAS